VTIAMNSHGNNEAKARKNSHIQQS